MSDRPEPPVRVKICGLARREDARWADECGADYLGVVVSAGFGRSVPIDEAARVVQGARAQVVAVTVDETPADALAMADAIGASVIQLHGSEPPEAVAALRAAGGRTLWKAVRARSVEDVAGTVGRYAEHVDGILVEGWKEGVVGGGGATLGLDGDTVRATLPAGLDFVLAGGLTPESVGVTLARFRPDVVDVSSGVEAESRVKDPERVRAFIEQVRAASSVPETPLRSVPEAHDE